MQFIAKPKWFALFPFNAPFHHLRAFWYARLMIFSKRYFELTVDDEFRTQSFPATSSVLMLCEKLAPLNMNMISNEVIFPAKQSYDTYIDNDNI